MFYIPKSPFQAIKSSFQAIYPDSPLNHDHNLQKINKNFIIFLKNKTLQYRTIYYIAFRYIKK
jgi:hypothetical protein